MDEKQVAAMADDFLAYAANGLAFKRLDMKLREVDTMEIELEMKGRSARRFSALNQRKAATEEVGAVLRLYVAQWLIDHHIDKATYELTEQLYTAALGKVRSFKV